METNQTQRIPESDSRIGGGQPMMAPAEALATPFPPASHRLGESANWVVGVVDDATEARAAALAALQGDLDDESVLVLNGREALAVIDAKEADMNPVMRLYTAASRALTDPGNAETEYRQEAERGHSLVCIRAATPAEVERARQLLLTHSARQVKHFGAWTLNDLVP